jgi:fatty acid desaturase
MSYQPTMAVVFAAIFLALVFGWLNRRRLAVACLFACLVLAVWQFLFEIYDPKTGFRMPWIQTQLQNSYLLTGAG